MDFFSFFEQLNKKVEQMFDFANICIDRFFFFFLPILTIPFIVLGIILDSPLYARIMGLLNNYVGVSVILLISMIASIPIYWLHNKIYFFFDTDRRWKQSAGKWCSIVFSIPLGFFVSVYPFISEDSPHVYLILSIMTAVWIIACIEIYRKMISS